MAQIKRLHGWLLEVEHLLDKQLGPAGAVVSNVAVGSCLDRWRERMAAQLTDGSLSELEQECLTEFLQVLSNLRPYLVQCYDRQDFPRTNNDMERSIRGRKHAVSSRQWAQELERLSVALRALCGLRGLVGARYSPSNASGAARRPA